MEYDISECSVVSHIIDTPLNTENFNFERFLNTFHTAQLDISNQWLINIGTGVDGVKRYIYLFVRGYISKPFFGPHLISVYLKTETSEELTTMWVHSLTFLRKELFLFHDRLSFERSTFLVTPSSEESPLIRLKSIRGFITIPKLQWSEHPVSSPRKARSQQKIEEMLNHHIQHMVTFLGRETNQELIESIDSISTYVAKYCYELKQLLS
jgi:hypothetical protein